MKNIKFKIVYFYYFLLTFAVSANVTQKIVLTAIPTTENELVNPDRGLYRWNDKEEVPVACIDHYRRYSWSELEKSEGVYDFSVLKAGAEKARLDADGRGTFSFGVRCVVQGNDHSYPAYLDAKMASWYSKDRKCWVPDWNNAYFLERMDAFVAALGREFNKDPRIGYIEIRSYGNWGEWHLGHFEKPIAPVVEITTPTIQGMVNSYVKAFPDKQLIMINNPIALEYSISVKGLKYPIGWRADNWSNLGFRKFEASALWPKAAERWKIAPVIVEAYGNNKNTFSFSLQQTIDYHISAIGNGNIGKWEELSDGAKDSMLLTAKTAGYRNVLRNLSYPSNIVPGQSIHLLAEWSNTGVAPVYRDWNVTYRIISKNSGKLLCSLPSKLDLRKLLPTYDFTTKKDSPLIVDDTFVIPAEIPKGNYEFEMLVSDPTLYLSPLQIAIQGRKSNGAYSLGQINVSAK